MNTDFMRDTAVLKLHRNKHPDCELTFSSELKLGSTTGTQLSIGIRVNPCRECQREIDRIKSAVKILTETNS